MQRAAKEAVEKGLLEMDKREGFRGPVRHLTPDEALVFKKEKIKEFIVITT